MQILTILGTFFGTLFRVGEDLSPSFNEWADKVLIPSEERASVNKRLRRAKWLLKHYPKLTAQTLVVLKFPEQNATMQQSIVDFLTSELQK